MTELHLDRDEWNEILHHMREALNRQDSTFSNESQAYRKWLANIVLKLELALS